MNPPPDSGTDHADDRRPPFPTAEGSPAGSGSGRSMTPEALDALLDELEHSRAHAGFNLDHTRRLYFLLDLCRRPEHAQQAVRALRMLVYLHYSENDERELRDRSQEGAQWARRVGDEPALRRFEEYHALADRMQERFVRSWGGILLVLGLGTLGAATVALSGVLGLRSR